MRFLAAGTLVGTFGWLTAEAVRVSTGSESLAALCFGLTASLIVWGFELRRKLDEPQQGR